MKTEYISIPCVIHIPLASLTNAASRDEVDALVIDLSKHLPQGSVVLLAEDYTNGLNTTDEETDLPGALRAACPAFVHFEGVAPNQDETVLRLIEAGFGT